MLAPLWNKCRILAATLIHALQDSTATLILFRPLLAASGQWSTITSRTMIWMNALKALGTKTTVFFVMTARSVPTSLAAPVIRVANPRSTWTRLSCPCVLIEEMGGNMISDVCISTDLLEETTNKAPYIFLFTYIHRNWHPLVYIRFTGFT